MKPTLKNEFIASVRKSDPDLWLALHPRTYKGVAGWCEPASPAATLCSHALRYLGVVPMPTAGGEHAPGVVLASCYMAAMLARCRVPAFFVGDHLLDAVAKTDPLPGVDWLTAPIPHPAGLFLLPNRGFPYPSWLAWARLEAGAELQVPGSWGVRPPVRVKHSVFIISAGVERDECNEQFIVARDGNFDLDTMVISDIPDPSFGSRVCITLALNLLLAVNMRPELIDRDGKRVRTIKAGPAREEWTPNWVGRGYRVPAADGDGTHASPRLHWRRGHYRRQACGVGRKEHKIIWLEPCLVGATEADEVPARQAA